MSKPPELMGIDLDQLRIQLNRDRFLVNEYPNLQLNEQEHPSELYKTVTDLIQEFNLNPKLVNVNINAQDLSNKNMNGAILNNKIFSDPKIINGATFNYADLVSAEFNDNSLYRTKFEFADLSGAHFDNSFLDRITFYNANLTNASFINTQFNYVILLNANLTGANLTGANLTNASFENTNLENIIYDTQTVFNDQIRRAINVPAEILERFPIEDEDEDEDEDQPQQGIAYEIHNAFDKIDVDKYNAILKKAIPSIHNETINKSNITTYFSTFITNHFPTDISSSSVQRFESIVKRLDDNRDLKPDGIVSNTIIFVKAQPNEFKTAYLEMFIKDCYEAYRDVHGNPLPGEQGMSCVKGISERVVWLIGDTAQIMCSAPDSTLCTPIYEELLDVFGKRKLLDINELSQEWAKILETDEFQDETRMPELQLKQHFINFMKEKYSEANMWNPTTEALVNKRAEELDYVFKTRTFGGRRDASTTFLGTTEGRTKLRPSVADPASSPKASVRQTSASGSKRRTKKTTRKRRKSHNKKKIRKQTTKKV